MYYVSTRIWFAAELSLPGFDESDVWKLG